jgi:hypothetical protein
MAQDTSSNPLQKYFRQPSIYVKLPSEGKYYPKDSIDIPSNGEIPIFPMTAMDEIITRTPDALFNGSAVAQLFQSCVPNIKDPWVIPQVDIDMLFTAIRIASYGHEMEMTVSCPHCNEAQDYALDLRNVIDQYGSPDFSKKLIIDDLEIFFKPLNYHEISESAQKQFEQQKRIQLTSEAENVTDEQKLKAMSEALTEVTKMTMNTMNESVQSISIGGQVVEDRQQINEFMQNIDRTLFKKIQDHLTSIRGQSEMKPLQITCRECNTGFEQPFTLDMSNFFV